ncbi:hypothetical protein BH10BDE1_BH10BDE1_03610 [soil metagenome]
MHDRSLILPGIVCLFLLAGCGKALEDFARIDRPVSEIVPFEGRSSIKISPGITTSNSTDVSMKAHVTITDRPLTGADVAGRISINRQNTGSTAR